MAVEIKKEVLKWTKTDDGERLELQIGASIDYTESKGVTTELRKAVSLSITRLVTLMSESQVVSQGEKEIRVETVQAEGRPYRMSQRTFGDEVPGFEWSPGGPLTETQEEETTDP